ncbi:uncharacterized protein LOC114318912 [Camellia sinensis]|uniref:uncharacterized protein LOC114318912 n=1 Tax=Camellia sinensis TaxID=4442 RepID=UPI0010363BAD|nr:uncharacterized protein LOC114318912 [Camellia sinensis]
MVASQSSQLASSFEICPSTAPLDDCCSLVPCTPPEELFYADDVRAMVAGAKQRQPHADFQLELSGARPTPDSPDPPRVGLNPSAYGGLALWWTDDVQIDIRYQSKNLIRGIITPPDKSTVWATSFVYAPPQRSLRKVGAGNIHERLDRALATVGWRSLYPCAQVFHEARFGSDHSPLLLSCCVPLKKVPRIFKFETMWTTSPACEDVIRSKWDGQHFGSPMFQLVSKLKSYKEGLKAWSKATFGNNQSQILNLKSQLISLQSHPFSEDNALLQRQLKVDLEEALSREEMYLHQRSRIRWLSYGHRNSQFFHASMIQRRQRNQLLRLQNEAGVWLHTEHEINQHLLGYFSNLFHSVGQRNVEEVLSMVTPVILKSMNHLLVRPLSDQEVKDAVFQLGAVKSPGPDGFSGCFYHKYWAVVGPHVCTVVLSFFLGGHLLKELNHTNLVLIPKVSHPVKLSQFRPISLCNFTLKIITKILANRLKQILKSIISPNQSAFVPGRMIQDNSIEAHEAFHFLKHKRMGRAGFMAIKLDFNKAYDRVEWDFLLELMRRMGFAPKWIQWVSECITSVIFSIFVNGEKRAAFTPSCGLRQGDPLSSYLFILVADVLSKLINHNLHMEAILGFKINRHCPTLSPTCSSWMTYYYSSKQTRLNVRRNFCAKLNSLISKFWWNGDPESRGIHWQKQGWRLVKYPNSFCARMLKGIYFPHSNFMEASRGQCVSSAWASLIQSRTLLCKGVRWQVYNGASIKFWDDKWIPSLPGFKVSSPKPPISRVNTVVDIIDTSHGLWKVDALQGLVSAAKVKAICLIPISLAHHEDTQIWHHGKSGVYTVKSGYHVAGQLKNIPDAQLLSTSF